jgi:hypothetical protein
MADWISWIESNWVTILEGYAVLVVLATFITKLTPTTADDKFLARVVETFSAVGIRGGLKVPGVPKG